MHVQSITFEVTADDIAGGHPCSTLDCPIALALGRKVKNAICRIDDAVIELRDIHGDVVASAPMTPEIKRFVSVFDQVSPFYMMFEVRPAVFTILFGQPITDYYLV